MLIDLHCLVMVDSGCCCLAVSNSYVYDVDVLLRQYRLYSVKKGGGELVSMGK